VEEVSFLALDALFFGQGCLTIKICDIIIKHGDIGGWKTCEVTNMTSLFDVDSNPQAVNFTESLNNWDVSKVTTMKFMFYGARAYNQPMDNWDVSKVTDMYEMFYDAAAYNQPMDNWDVSKVTDMKGMFEDATAYNQPMDNWNVSKVIYMDYMFAGAAAYNQPMDNWDVSKVTDMDAMFYDAVAFNQNLCAWGKVASFPYSAVRDMFVNSVCTYKADPTQATKGPFCADDCTAVFV
jgi:surface protein